MVTAACGATATNIVMKRLGLINLSQPTQRPGVMCMLFYIFIIIIILNFGGVGGFSCLLFVFVPLSLKTVRGLLEFPLATCCSMEFLMSLCYIAMHIFSPTPPFPPFYAACYVSSVISLASFTVFVLLFPRSLNPF